MYKPDEKILDKYADVLVNFGLHDGNGVNPGEVVGIGISDSARDFVEPLIKAVLKAGAHPILDYSYDNKRTLPRVFYEYASDEQLTHWPKDYLLEKIKLLDHLIGIDSTHNKHGLDGMDMSKIGKWRQAGKFVMDARNKKENEGKFSWTLCTYATQTLADDVGMSLEEYWDQIIKACYLDEDDPVSKWKEVSATVKQTAKWLTELQIDSVYVEGDDVGLYVHIGDERQWIGGGGRNVPSFEVFTSPDWRGTNGWIRFNQPLSRYGNVIEGIRLEFKDGIIVSATADRNEDALKQLIAIPNADKIGEFSLTDKRLSRITKRMGDILYDENMGGEYGNTHLAVGMAYRDTCPGDIANMTDEEFAELGFNDSAEHTDIISTSDRTVTATLKDGSEKVIYKDGMFQN